MRPGRENLLWEWLKGEIPSSELCGNVQAYLDLFTEWEANWAGIKNSGEAMRFKILGALLDYLSIRWQESIEANSTHRFGRTQLRALGLSDSVSV